MRTIVFLALVSLILAPCLACAGSKPPEAMTGTSPSPSTSPGVAQAQAQTMETPAHAATAGSVSISSDILKACDLPDADAYFAFDASRLERQDIATLNRLAACFATGPLKGRSMKLVGHADPRGPSAYNMTLGQARADAVQGYLVGRGLDKSKAESSSRGAMDATGKDETGWAHDRRVDVLLG